MILSGSWRHAVALGAFAGLGIVGLALSVPFTALIRDLTVTRLFQLATITFFSPATPSPTGETRRVLAARTEPLPPPPPHPFQTPVPHHLPHLSHPHPT